MAQFTLITRLSDGNPLIQSNDLYPGSGGNADMFRNQAKAIVSKLDSRSQTRLAVESGNNIFSYMMEDGIVYIVMTDKSYPKRLAFGYLLELQKAFTEDLMREYGDQWKHVVDTVDKPYAFMKFERILHKIRREFADANSSVNANRLKEELADVHNIMKKSINEVLDRGEKLEHVSKLSSKLVSDSKKYKWNAKKINLLDLYRTYGAIILVIVIILLFWKFFL